MQCVNSHDYGNGLKLMEHSYVGNDFVGVVEDLISEGGAWFGDRIVWGGDYADPEKDENGEDIQEEYEGKMYDVTLYSKVGKNRITPDKATGERPTFLVNLDTKEFVDLNKVREFEEGWKIHPLPLLTCEGNGRGGGDFHGKGNQKLIGKWARNRVIMQKTKPTEGKEIKFNLVES